MVLHFVEQEKCFEHVDFANSSEIHAKFEVELNKCYDYIKFDRKQLEKKIEEAYPTNHTSVKDAATYEEKYGEVNRLEKELEDLDTKWLVWIVENRGFFWS
jgi:PAB1-binding protein PBP1